MVEEFIHAGHEVRVSDRPNADYSMLAKLGVEIVPAELDDSQALARAVRGMDVVAHVAGIFDLSAPPELLEKVNHQGTRNMCEAVLQNAPNCQKFVHVSTVGVYGQPKNCPCRETDPKLPRNAYEISKLRGEEAAFEFFEKSGLPVTALRPTLIYGPRSRYGLALFVSLLSLRKQNGASTMHNVVSGPKGSHIHIEDMARAVRLVSQASASTGKAYNVAGPTPLAAPEMVRSLALALGYEVKDIVPFYTWVMESFQWLFEHTPPRFFNWIDSRLAKRWKEICREHHLTADLCPRFEPHWIIYLMQDCYFDTSELAGLGMEWKYPDPAKGLMDTIAWYKENRWIP